MEWFSDRGSIPLASTKIKAPAEAGAFILVTADYFNARGRQSRTSATPAFSGLLYCFNGTNKHRNFDTKLIKMAADYQKRTELATLCPFRVFYGIYFIPHWEMA